MCWWPMGGRGVAAWDHPERGLAILLSKVIYPIKVVHQGNLSSSSAPDGGRRWEPTFLLAPNKAIGGAIGAPVEMF